MKLTVLVENRAGKNIPAAHGLAYLIDDGVKSFLFDTGPSDLIIQNAKLLNIDLTQIDTIILSHGHWDHGNGLPYLYGKNLIAHSGAFVKRYRNTDNSSVGLPIDFEKADKEFHLALTKEPFKITGNTWFLGEIPRKTAFEKQANDYHLENGKNDTIPDDTAIATITSKGLIITTGCSHSGVCNIIRQAQTITGISQIYAVIGGFHLKTINNQLKETINCLDDLNIPHLYPSHCTGFEAQCEMAKQLQIKGLKTGDILVF